MALAWLLDELNEYFFCYDITAHALSLSLTTFYTHIPCTFLLEELCHKPARTKIRGR